MIIALVICVIFGFLLWLVFFKCKWLKFTPVWGVVSAFFWLFAIFCG